MSDVPLTSDWWQASDGLWYAPELHPAWRPVTVLPPIPGPSTAALPPVLPPIPGPSAASLPPSSEPSRPVLPPLPPASNAAPPTYVAPNSPTAQWPTAHDQPRTHLKWLVAVIVIAILALIGGIAYLVGRDDSTATSTPPTIPIGTNTSTSTSTSPSSTSTAPSSIDNNPTIPSGPIDPDLTPVDPASEAALVQAINSGGPARADGFSGPDQDTTLVQLGHAICLTADQLATTGGDAASLIAQTLTSTRDQLAESSAVLWADPTRASEGFGRVLYYGVKYLCPAHLPGADAAFPDLAGT